MSDDEGITRQHYTWTHCVKDLALSTNLTLKETIDLTYPFEQAGIIHPYDAMPILAKILVATSNKSYGEAGRQLVKLQKATTEQDRSQARRARIGDLNFTQPPNPSQ